LTPAKDVAARARRNVAKRIAFFKTDLRGIVFGSQNAF